MNKVSDKELAIGLRQRKKPATIAAEVRETIVSQMHADAMRLPLEKISVSPYQVRQITEQALEHLMESIKDTGGLITPVVVRPVDDKYELVAGHTRFLACSRLGHRDIPAVVRPMTDAEAARALVADNLTRKDLSDFEIFKQLSTLFTGGFLKSNSEAARLLGRTRQDIIRYQAYGNLPPEVINLLEQQPELIGASAVKALIDYLPVYIELVIEVCQRLASGRIKTQTAALTWLQQRLREKPARLELCVLDKAGNTVGKITRDKHGIRLISKILDLSRLETVITKELQDQGYRM